MDRQRSASQASDASGPAEGPAPAPPVKRKAKTKKDGRPRRPASGYQLYMADVRSAVTSANPNVGFGQVTKILGAQWSNMSDSEKEPFLERAKALREDYEVALAEWAEDQKNVAEAAGAAPKRSASSAAAATIAAVARSEAGPADAGGGGGGGGSTRKRRRANNYSGLGNLAEDENDDLVCKTCRAEFSSVDEKREHLLSRSHQEAASEVDAARPARDIALTIPIFTDEFVQHYERREKALKELRQESDQLVRNNSVMAEQIDKLKESIGQVREATDWLNEETAELSKDADELKAVITGAFRGVVVEGFPDGPGGDEASIDTYLQALAVALESGKGVDVSLREKAAAAASVVERQWNSTVSGSV